MSFTESNPSTSEIAKCACTEDTSSTLSPLSPHCACPRDDHEIVIHEETCLMYKNEKIIFPHEPEVCECESPPFESGICECCACLIDQCHCKKAGREALDEWRKNRDVGAMPAVLESSHPLMQRFQETLKRFLDKENAVAEEEILNLRDELKQSKLAYDADLETIYRSDHDTNAQRVLIEEYEAELAKKTKERMDAEQHARESNEKYRKYKDRLDTDMVNEREALEELEALSALVRQLEQWRDETESDLTVSQRMSDKMRAEKQQLADEKRELDVTLYFLSNECWKLESKLELFKKQFEIKNNEMNNVNDKVTAYAAELEDLELDKRRLMSLWKAVLVNIKQRDNVFDSVRDDYKNLQENYRTLISNFEITKKVTMEEMEKSKELEMNKDKILYDTNAATKLFETENARRESLETQINDLIDSIDMTERDQEMIKMENQAMGNTLKSTEKDFDHRTLYKLKLENEILANLQDCLLNDKAVESMANGIKKMRDMSRKLEISLMAMENQHARMMLDIEIHRNRQARNNGVLEKSLTKVREREGQLDVLQEKYDQKMLVITRKQRELDIISKKFTALKEVFDLKSPQERRIEDLEQQIKSLRERTETMQHEWLRLQGHVVKLTLHHHKMVYDISLLNKQIQICEQKTMRYQAHCENVQQERVRVGRSLRDLRSQLEVLERARNVAAERNKGAQRANLAVTHEYSANLKNAESEIIDLEEEIEALDKEKIDLTQELDRVQREALIWQRKGILAVELKRNIHNAKSAAGEIGQMKNEIHRMEVRREQLRRTSEKLAEDMALYVTRRETAVEKTRASAAVEKAHGNAGHTSQSAYHHKLRLARADVARVTKGYGTILGNEEEKKTMYDYTLFKDQGHNLNVIQDLADAKANLESLQKEQERLEKDISTASAMNSQLEEHVATLLREWRETERQKQWLLERVVRSQRLGSELATAVKRQSIRVRKPKSTVLAEYDQARSLNDRIKYIIENLAKEYPYLDEKLSIISNTVNIYTPDGSPRLTEEAPEMCDLEEVEEGTIEEETSSENVAEKPYCRQ